MQLAMIQPWKRMLCPAQLDSAYSTYQAQR